MFADQQTIPIWINDNLKVVCCVVSISRRPVDWEFKLIYTRRSSVGRCTIYRFTQSISHVVCSLSPGEWWCWRLRPRRLPKIISFEIVSRIVSASTGRKRLNLLIGPHLRNVLAEYARSMRLGRPNTTSRWCGIMDKCARPSFIWLIESNAVERR